MEDYVRFTLTDVRPIKVEDDYRDGYTVTFVASLGAKEVQHVSVDLVADQIIIGEPEVLDPVDRVSVRGISTCDYPVYPAEKSVVDKFCGIVERHRGHASSRVKDLVDLVIYALTVDLEMRKIKDVVNRELSLRGMSPIGEFALPVEWGHAHARQYEKLASGANLPGNLRKMEGGMALAKRLLDPVFVDDSEYAVWDHRKLEWAGEVAMVAGVCPMSNTPRVDS